MPPILRAGTEGVRPSLPETAELGRTLAGAFTTSRPHSKRNRRQTAAASTVVESPAAPAVTQQKDRSNGASSPGHFLDFTSFLLTAKHGSIDRLKAILLFKNCYMVLPGIINVLHGLQASRSLYPPQAGSTFHTTCRPRLCGNL